MMTMYKIIFLFTIVLFLTLSCDKNVSRSPVEHIELENGSIYIDSYPKGALIFVDGKLSGNITPDTVKWLKEGSHEFSLKLDQFEDIFFNIEANNDTIINYFYDYASDPLNFGSISVRSDPSGCSILLNDSLLPNFTPFEITNLFPNIYKIKLTFPEHRADSSLIKVNGSKKSVLDLNLTDTTTWVNYDTYNSPMIDHTLFDVFVDDENFVWMSTREGITKNRGKDWTFYDMANSSLPNNRIYKVRKDRNNVYWIATIAGLSTFHNNEWNTFTRSNSQLPGNYISDFDFDNLGNIWVATNGGLVKISDSDWTIYNSRNSGIPSNFITAVSIDKNNNKIWIGTINAGIARFDGIDNWIYFKKALPPDDLDMVGLGNFSIYKTELENYHSINGDSTLMGNTISAIKVDNNGVVWAGFTPSPKKGVIGGVEKYENGSWEIVNLGLVDKTIYSFYIGQNNDIWISSQSGLININNYTDVKFMRRHDSGLPTNDISAVYPDNLGNLWIATMTNGVVKYKNYLPN